MLSDGAKQHLKDCCRLGLRNQYNEEVEIKGIKTEKDFDEFIKEKEDIWDSLILHEGTFASVGLKRFYRKDEQINVKDKNHIPYRGFMMPVLKRDVFVIQCIAGDFVILRILGKEEDLDEIAKSARPDNKLNLGMTYEEFKEANRRDLEYHKRIKTFEANFNKSPERFDSQGNVITSLDHYDNFEYIVRESNEQIYKIYNGEKEKRRLENKLIYLEEKKMDYDYSIDEKYIEDAVDALVTLYPGEVEKYFTNGGKYIHENLNKISFETELTKGQVWKVWKYLDWLKVEQDIERIKKVINDIDECMDIGKTAKVINDDDILPNLFE